MKLIDQALFVIRKSIIFYSDKNATQKIWEVPGAPLSNLPSHILFSC